MAAPLALAKFAVFTDVFLSGLIMPLIPSIVETRVQVPREQVQVLVSVLVSAHGGALVAVSPLMPFLVRQDRSRYVVLIGALVLAAASFALLQLSSSLPVLVLARALHGLSAAAITGASSGIAAAVTSVELESTTLSWITQPLIHSTAFSLAPVVAGYLHDYTGGERSVFFCAYAVIILLWLLGVLVIFFAPEIQAHTTSQTEYTPAVEPAVQSYGTISLRGGELRSGYSSVSSSRTASSSATGSRRLRGGSIDSIYSNPEDAAPVFGIRMFTALYGYLVVGLLTAALQSVIPLFAQQQLKWSVSAIGVIFIPMTLPALITSSLSRVIAVRVPRSARFTVALGFLLCVPAFACLGHLRENTKGAEQMSLFAILGAVSFGIGLCADPLVKEITRLMNEADRPLSGLHHLSAAATLPTVAHAWGTLIGPLFAGGTHWISGWHTMAKSLAGLSALTALFTFVFLQGWIGHFQPLKTALAPGPVSDEESAPLLRSIQNGGSHATPIGDNPRSLRKKADFFEPPATDSSEGDLGSSIRTDRQGRHRRHFSIDNFSIATTAVDGRAGVQPDADGQQQVRFQAALETPAAMGSSFKQQLGNPERRFVMREAPHAPATDPLLASGNRYVIDEAGADGERAKRHVVVFEEGTVPAGLLERRQHHVVAINSVDGSVRLASSMDTNHAVHVTEEDAPDQFEFPESSRRYVVVLLERGDISEEAGHEST